MIFGQVSAAADPLEAIAAMPDGAEICGCNGVAKSTIVAAIAEHDLTTVDAVRARTKAHPPAAPAPTWSRACSS